MSGGVDSSGGLARGVANGSEDSKGEESRGIERYSAFELCKGRDGRTAFPDLTFEVDRAVAFRMSGSLNKEPDEEAIGFSFSL
jgi:hypothetical protein